MKIKNVLDKNFQVVNGVLEYKNSDFKIPVADILSMTHKKNYVKNGDRMVCHVNGEAVSRYYETSDGRRMGTHLFAAGFRVAKKSLQTPPAIPPPALFAGTSENEKKFNEIFKNEKNWKPFRLPSGDMGIKIVIAGIEGSIKPTRDPKEKNNFTVYNCINLFPQKGTYTDFDKAKEALLPQMFKLWVKHGTL